MTRRLLNILTVLSLLLYAAVAVMWVRSYWVSDELIRATGYVDVSTRRVWSEDTEYLQSSHGWWAHGNFRADPDAMYTYEHTNRPQSVMVRDFEWRRTPAPLAIQFRATRFGGETPVPYWATALALAVLPVSRVTWPRVRAGNDAECAWLEKFWPNGEKINFGDTRYAVGAAHALAAMARHRLGDAAKAREHFDTSARLSRMPPAGQKGPRPRPRQLARLGPPPP